jgi:hypothetical protein
MAEPTPEFTEKLIKVSFWLTIGACTAFCLAVVLFIL